MKSLEATGERFIGRRWRPYDRERVPAAAAAMYKFLILQSTEYSSANALLGAASHRINAEHLKFLSH